MTQDLAKWCASVGIRTKEQAARALGVSERQFYRYQCGYSQIPKSVQMLMNVITYLHKHGIDIAGVWPMKSE